jgi:phosphoribosylamine---glycine ligase
MNILLIGSGGREHALAWKLAQSPVLTRLYAAPGNPGIAAHATCLTLDPADHGAVTAFCRTQGIDLVVVGPEAPLVAGLADDLRAAGIAVFGPGKAAAQLEGSKGFTKDLCSAVGIPTAAYERYRDADSARAGLSDFGLPVVIKADGLAAGKGVIIAETRDEARAAIADMFEGSFGDAGAAIVIEEFLTGEEASFFALSDGKTVIAFATAQDHKRVGEGDTGPNTGGMGAYSPAAVMTPVIQARVMRDIIEPTVSAMADAGMPFVGVLFAGLMLTDDGPQLIEYNVRWGDPEAEAILPRFTGDLAVLLHAAATGGLADCPLPEFSEEAALCVVMAAKGYPASPERGGAIRELDEASSDGALIFHAGTRDDGNGLVADGGRVLAITALGKTIGMARDLAYRAIDRIDFPTGFSRRDIGWRQIAREQATDSSDLD